MQSLIIPRGEHNPVGYRADRILAALQGRAFVTNVENELEIDMTLVVVDQAEEAFLDLILAVNYTLHLFKNDVTNGLTTAQRDALDESDFTEADFTGYSATALTGGSWTSTPGNPGVGVYAQQAFVSSADQAIETIYGYYVTTTTGGFLRWFEYFTSPVVIQYNNEQIRVTPRMTLQDTQD